MTDRHIGRVIRGVFRIEEHIGVGGMGDVYLATRQPDGAVVAVKILRAGDTEPSLARRFRREALAASRLAHKNIITVVDFGQDEELLFIAMEYVDGPNLMDVLRKAGKLGTRRALSIADGVLAALEAAHAQGIVHRDIKPANIMLDGTNEVVKVCDFGLVKALEPDLDSLQSSLTRQGQILGTPAFMSPEQAQGKKVDARSDLFAVGGVLYLMLTGTLAFPGDRSFDVMHAVINDPHPPLHELLPNVPDTLSDLVDLALAKPPDQRPATALTMRRLVAAVMDALPSDATAPVEAVSADDAPTLVDGPKSIDISFGLPTQGDRKTKTYDPPEDS